RVNSVILCLLSADFILALAVPFYASFLLNPSLALNRHACTIRAAITHTTVLASGLSLVLVTTDRYVAIVHPYRYARHGALPRLRLWVAALWLYALGVGVATMVWGRWPRLSVITASSCSPSSITPAGSTVYSKLLLLSIGER